MSGQRFPYVSPNPAPGSAKLVPRLPIILEGPTRIAVEGLLDTGAVVSVLPWSVGARLGKDWGLLPVPLQLGGNLASVPAKLVLVRTTVGSFAPVLLSFAWARSDAVPILLGQINFFQEFDVCFFGSQAEFEVRPKGGP